MTRWAMVTTGLYVALLVALTLPFLVLVGARCPQQMLVAFTSGWYWLVIAVLGLAQALLLVVPVRAAKRVEIKRRHILVPVVAVGVLVLLLLVGAVASVMAAILGDAFCEGGASAPSFWIAILVVGVLWTLWFFIFRRWARRERSNDKLLDKLTSFLLKGSILELLVAVSCHIIVRRRGDCSAPGFTFLGIAAGIAVMLMAFGPGLFWLFVQRRARIAPKIPCGGQAQCSRETLA